MSDMATVETPGDRQRYLAAIAYIRAKTDQLLTLMGTLPLRPEELDDTTLLELDPIGIVCGSFSQILAHLNETNQDLGLAKREIRAILDALDASVIVVGHDGILEECNREARERFFASHPNPIGQPLADICSCRNSLPEVLSGQANERTRVIDGRHYLIVSSRIADDLGQPLKVVLLLFDVTHQDMTEANLRLYAQVFDHTGEGILISDHNNRIIEVNAAFTRITGYEAHEVQGKNPSILRSDMHPPGFYRAMWKDLIEKGYWRGEIIDRAKNGTTLPLLYSISRIYDESGQLTHHIALITDISHLKEAQDRLDYLAHHDGLTNLSNRLLFNDRLEQAIARAKRDSCMFGLLFIDLDRFKNINDSLGHHIGDLVLIEVASRLSSLVRQTDTVARLGGDEFVILIEKMSDHGDVDRLAETVLAALRAPFVIEGNELHLGCSIGITIFPEDGLDPTALMKNADTAMYSAKESGRDSHARFSRALADSVETRMHIENALRGAERNGEFVLHYQPIVDLTENRVLAAEALIRWPAAPDNATSPAIFIPIAEETRLILPIGDWVLRHALTQFLEWRRTGLQLDYISINLSAVQLGQPRFVGDLERLLDTLTFDGRHLLLELTENVLMRDIDRCQPVLARLRARGVRIAIDDFGTGYSSLAYLKLLPIDSLKIDRGFVRDIPGDTNDAAIAKAIIGLADTLGLRAIAEGIETEEQEAFLRGVGCHLVQGYRYARPLPADDFARFVRDYPG